MKWVKLEVKLNHDPEWGRLDGDSFRFGIQLLMLGGELESNGKLLNCDDISWHLRHSRAKTAKWLKVFEAIDFIYCDESGIWHIRNWAAYQAKTSTERVNKHRDRKEAALQKQQCNVTETLQERPREEKTIYKEEKRERGRAREKAKPDNVDSVSDFMQTYCIEKGHAIDYRCAAERFFNHFESNGWKVSGRTAMKDWKAAARNWIERDVKNEIRSTTTHNHDRRSAQERANERTTADIAPALNSAYVLLEEMRKAEGHTRGPESDGTVFLGDGSGDVRRKTSGDS